MIKKVLLIIALCCTYSQIIYAIDKKFVLVIDAGHGGRDAGALGKFSKEKNINLEVALAFGRLVEKNSPDVKVVYTRKTDVFIPLYERAEIANRNKADLFVSVHTNALERGRTVKGFETYTLGDGRSQATKTNLEVAKRENSVILLEDNYKQHYVGYDPNSPESNIMFEFVQDKNLSKSIDFAKMLQQNVCRQAGRPNKGVHQSNLAVLRLTSMPACLIELGFITTPEEEQLLNDKNKTRQIAKGLYNAFVEYKNKHYNGIVVPYKTDTKLLEDNDNTNAPTPTADTTSARPTPKTDSKDAPVCGEPEILVMSDNDFLTTGTTPPDAKATEKTSPDKTVRQAEEPASKPIFKIQIIAGNKKLKNDDSSFKGLEGCECYEENGMMKYTYGASDNYNEIYGLYKKVHEKFPGAFIIAFKDGKKMDVNQAIREYKKNKK